MTLTVLRWFITVSMVHCMFGERRTTITTALIVPSKDWPIMARNAFSPAECDSIIELYTTQLKRVQDTREAESVSRINRFDVDGKLLQRGDLDWILDRVTSKLPLDDGVHSNAPLQSGEQLKACIDFTLLHEFHKGMHFGLHVDTKPNDGTYRTYNINIMLSDPSSYQGGELQMGASIMKGLNKGDLYMYPASLPHAVHPLEGGLRYTFVMALTVPSQYRSKDQQESYWAASEQRFHGLMGNMEKDLESRLYLIYAQFLEASGDRTEEDIDAAYCKSYKATPEAPQYARHFLENGKMAQSVGDTMSAFNYFKMAACVDPTLGPVVQELIPDMELLLGGVKDSEL